MSPLADAVYDLLRCRSGSPEPRISYAELGRDLRELSDDFATINHRSRELYAALGEVADKCRRLGLPSLAALVVRADSRRPGDAYWSGEGPRHEQIEALHRELEEVKGSTYPPRNPSD